MANVIKHKRGSGSDPVASDLVVGEVAIRTDVGKLFTKMDNGAVAEIAGGGSDIAINTLSSSSGTGGGSATFNGSAYRFTLSQPPSVSAQQLLVSINGVIQKPVAGTGQPSEGFSVDGTDIILGDAPATGSDFFILTFKSLGVSEPADNSVTSAKIVDGAIVNADINASAAIAGTKISPDFGSQTITTTGNITTTGDLTVGGTYPAINLYDSNNNPDWRIQNNNGMFAIFDQTNGANRVQINTDGHIDLLANVDISNGLDVTGAITGTGDMTIDTNTLHVDSTNNRVGIGTTSPIRQLDINNSSHATLALTSTTQSSLFFADDDTNIGQISYMHGTNYMYFRVNDAERMRIDSSGAVRIGHTDAIGNASADNLVIGTGSGNNGLSIYSGNDSQGRIDFRDTTGTSDGQGIIFYQHTTDSLQIHTNSAERMRIDSSGNAVVGATSANGSDACTLNSDGEFRGAGFYFSNNIGSPMSSDGIRRATTGTMVFDTASTERMRIKSDGDVLLTRATAGGGGNETLLISANYGSGSDQAIQASNNLRFYTNGANERIRIDSNGRVNINTASAISAGLVNIKYDRTIFHGLNLQRTTSGTGNNLSFLNSSASFVGSITSTDSATAYNTSSDYRLKENAVAISDGITRLKTLKPYKFNWIVDETNTLVDGFFAHEVSNAVPEAVTGTKDQIATDSDNGFTKGDPIYQQIDQSKLVPLLVAALQEAVARIEALEAK